MNVSNNKTDALEQFIKQAVVTAKNNDTFSNRHGYAHLEQFEFIFAKGLISPFHKSLENGSIDEALTYARDFQDPGAALCGYIKGHNRHYYGFMPSTSIFGTPKELEHWLINIIPFRKEVFEDEHHKYISLAYVYTTNQKRRNAGCWIVTSTNGNIPVDPVREGANDDQTAMSGPIVYFSTASAPFGNMVINEIIDKSMNHKKN